MFSKPKLAKSQQPDKTPFTIHDPHTCNVEHREELWEKEKYIQVASIDPAVKNLALRVEKRYRTGTISPLVFVKVDINPVADDENNCTAYKKLSAFLETYKSDLINCHYVLIERQLPENYRAVRISQHTITWFMEHLKNNSVLTLIYEVDPKLKGRQLGASSNLNKRGLKQWAVEEATKILQQRNDQVSLAIMKKAGKKQDDLGDTIVQIEALFKYLGLQTTQPILKILI
jgi:hypothetical protein